MMGIRQRGNIWWLEGRISGRRVQLSLGTRNEAEASKILGRIKHALAEGPESDGWSALQPSLPARSFKTLAKLTGVKERPEVAPVTWAALSAAFTAEAERRIILDKMRRSTWTRYRHTMDLFGTFLAGREISAIASINRALVEDFKVWRLEESKKKKQDRGGRGVVLDAAILHRVFNYAIECEMLARNPVRLEGRPGDNPESGAQPFKAAELARMREHAGPDMLAFLLLRYTGFRGSDAVGLRWEEIDFEAREISRLTQKRGKRVVLPIHTELFFALETERERRNPKPLDRVLLNPSTGKPLTRPRLYERIVALGLRAGASHAHPHRFRDTLAVDLLASGASPYDVAKMLGDTVETVEKHYAPFVRVLRERVRRIMESGEGLEKPSVTFQGQSPAPDGKPN